MQTQTLIDATIIVGTILTVIGIAKLATYIMERTTISPIRWWHVGGKETSAHYKQDCKNHSIQYLHHVVNHRKTALHKLFQDGYITWAEYYAMYERLMIWKDETLKYIDASPLTTLYM